MRVDPTTGNLAVLANSTGNQVIAAVYPEGSGTPTTYTLPVGTQRGKHGCTYDDSGDLFVEVQSKNYRADDIAELPNGGSSFSILTPNRNIKVKTLQWVSSDLAAVGKGVVYSLAISGSRIQVTGETKRINRGISAGSRSPTFWSPSMALTKGMNSRTGTIRKAARRPKSSKG